MEHGLRACRVVKGCAFRVGLPSGEDIAFRDLCGYRNGRACRILSGSRAVFHGKHVDLGRRILIGRIDRGVSLRHVEDGLRACGIIKRCAFRVGPPAGEDGPFRNLGRHRYCGACLIFPAACAVLHGQDIQGGRCRLVGGVNCCIAFRHVEGGLGVCRVIKPGGLGIGLPAGKDVAFRNLGRYRYRGACLIFPAAGAVLHGQDIQGGRCRFICRKYRGIAFRHVEGGLRICRIIEPGGLGVGLPAGKDIAFRNLGRYRNRGTCLVFPAAGAVLDGQHIARRSRLQLSVGGGHRDILKGHGEGRGGAVRIRKPDGLGICRPPGKLCALRDLGRDLDRVAGRVGACAGSVLYRCREELGKALVLRFFIGGFLVSGLFVGRLFISRLFVGRLLISRLLVSRLFISGLFVGGLFRCRFLVGRLFRCRFFRYRLGLRSLRLHIDRSDRHSGFRHHKIGLLRGRIGKLYAAVHFPVIELLAFDRFIRSDPHGGIGAERRNILLRLAGHRFHRGII